MRQRKAKKSKKTLYFGPEVETAILLFNDTQDTTLKNKLYRELIHPAFDKLGENIIHTFKFYYNDTNSYSDAKHELVVFLSEKLGNYRQTNGKAFSYFSIVAKNFCIGKTRVNYKKAKRVLSTDTITEDSHGEFLTVVDNYGDLTEEQQFQTKLSNFMAVFVNYWETNVNEVFSKKEDVSVVWAVVELFKKRENLEIFNKKALYLYIREMTNADTNRVTAVVRVVKDHYKKMISDYIEHNCLTKARYD